MGTLTANILIGSPHPNKDGIIPSHYMFLSENSAPSWTLVKENVDNEDKNKYPNIVWLPTVENMLEDGLLMVATHVLKNHEILEMAKDYTNQIESKRLELYSDLDDGQRNNLYQKCRELSKFPKLIISSGQIDIREDVNQRICNIINNLKSIDSDIDQVMDGWRLKRLPRIDRDILRLAYVDINFLNTPVAVACDEAVNLANKYSDLQGRKFINGVLRRLQSI